MLALACSLSRARFSRTFPDSGLECGVAHMAVPLGVKDVSVVFHDSEDFGRRRAVGWDVVPHLCDQRAECVGLRLDVWANVAHRNLDLVVGRREPWIRSSVWFFLGVKLVEHDAETVNVYKLAVFFTPEDLRRNVNCEGV